jgi:hypothetical protein
MASGQKLSDRFALPEKRSSVTTVPVGSLSHSSSQHACGDVIRGPLANDGSHGGNLPARPLPGAHARTDTSVGDLSMTPSGPRPTNSNEQRAALPSRFLVVIDVAGTGTSEIGRRFAKGGPLRRG